MLIIGDFNVNFHYLGKWQVNEEREAEKTRKMEDKKVNAKGN